MPPGGQGICIAPSHRPSRLTWKVAKARFAARLGIDVAHVQDAREAMKRSDFLSSATYIADICGGLRAPEFGARSKDPKRPTCNDRLRLPFP
jgi:hypothetical protein